MATSSHNHLLLVILVQVLLLLIVGTGRVRKVEGAWCVAKSNVSPTQLQTALDYACGAGADCAPITSSGLCFLPNTIQAHASYAFNSYYQRKSNAPGSCDFSSSATIATTDPSYGSCVYPPNPSSAGGGSNTPVMPTPTPPGTILPSNTPPPPPMVPGGIITPTPPGFGPVTPDGSLMLQSSSTILCCLLFISCFLLIF